MNRELKFRGWSMSLNLMFDIAYLHVHNGHGQYAPGASAFLSNPDIPRRFGPDDMQIMQFTGLKDRNGKDIYEGDIIIGIKGYVKSDGYKKKGYPDEIKVLCVVRYKCGSFTWPEVIKPVDEHLLADATYNYRELRYCLTPRRKGCFRWNEKERKHNIEGDDMTCEHIEVIGNIYANPELISID